MRTVLCLLALFFSFACVQAAEKKMALDINIVRTMDTESGKQEVHVILKGEGLYNAKLLAHPKGDLPPDTVRIVSWNDDYMDMRLKTDDKTSKVRLSGMRFRLERGKESCFHDDNHRKWEVTKGNAPAATKKTVSSIGSLWWQKDKDGKIAWFFQEMDGSKTVRIWKRVQPE